MGFQPFLRGLPRNNARAVVSRHPERRGPGAHDAGRCGGAGNRRAQPRRRGRAIQREVTEPLYLDLAILAGAGFAQALPASHNAFVYVYHGGLQIGGTYIPAHRMAILKNDVDSDGVVLKASAASRALLIAGKPLGEPIAQYGLFVMNTRDEIFQAVQDYQAGKFAATT
jgi:redox-sensitive bicupin YhaK (pirin superfamily)